MANKFATNFAIPGDANVFQVIWKLTRVAKAAGWVYKASGDGTSIDTTGVASADLWGGNANPLLDTYGGLANLSDASAGWWVASGPKTVKIPLSANPTGTFLRGEIVTQATSGATGEIFGYTWDFTGSSGWAVIGPQTGTFDNSHVVTGNISGATFTPTGTVITYNREIMIGKPAADTVDGSVYYVCADASAESAQLFSNVAVATPATATNWPGGNSDFPTKAIAIRGTGGSLTSDTWMGAASGFGTGTHAQIACVNATAASTITADGTFYIVSSTGTPNSLTGLSFMRLDDTEPGDVDPYAWIFTQGTNQFSAYSRTTNTSGGLLWTFTNLVATNFYNIFGYQSRGNTFSSSIRDVSFGYNGAFEHDNFSGGNAYAIIAMGNGPIRTLNSPATIPPLVREPMLVYAGGQTAGTFKQIKGRTRWLQATSQGNPLDTFDTKTWLGIISAATSVPCIIIGPYDGTTTPTA
jgi:hypothetical protein